MKINTGRILRSLLVVLGLLPTPVLATDIFQLCAEQSLVTIFVDREGGFSRFGHQHLVSIHSLEGKVRLQTPISQSTAELKAAFTDMRIDIPALRKAAGMEGALSEKAIGKTRRNMLEKVLSASQYPEVKITISSMVQQGQSERVSLNSKISLHGQTVDINIPATIEFSENMLRTKGQFRINQSNFGIKQFKALLGALAVADELLIEFDVVAARVCD